MSAETSQAVQEGAAAPVSAHAPVPGGKGTGLRRRAPVLAAAAMLTLSAFGGGWLAARLAGGDSARPGPAAREAADANRAVQALDARVRRLEAEQALVARVAAASLAVVNLTAATENEAGFQPALAAAQRVLPASPDLQALQPLAAQGAPTRAILVEAFPGAAARARGAVRATGGGNALGGFSRALDRLFGGAPPPEPRGLSLDAVIARAEARVAAGDLTGAADALAALPPPAQPAFASWMDGARRRAEIDRRLAAVRLLALNQFAAVAAPTPGP